MLKRIGVALLLLAIAATGTALAQQNYTGSVLVTTNMNTPVWHRLYNPAWTAPAGQFSISPSGETNCAPNADFAGFDTTTRACQSIYKTPSGKPAGYKGYLEDIGNDNGTPDTLRYIVWDNEQNAGTASHTGYYFFAGSIVSVGQVSQWNLGGCAGTFAQSCVGQGTGDNTTGTSAGTAALNTPLGQINPLGGFRPIPVPTVSSANKNTGDMVLNWVAASDANGNGTVSYDVYGIAKANCTAPLASEYGSVLRNVAGATTTTVNVSAFGNAPTTPACYFFAIKLSYPNAGATPVKSLFFSANSQGVTFGGAAATVTNIKAVRTTGTAIAVSWNTSLEDGLKGFYVLRSFTENGTFERVSGLVAAKGRPSAYTFIDTKAPVGQVRGTGVYYKIQTADMDNNVTAYGPVKADLGMTPGPHERGQQIKENKAPQRLR